MEIIRSIHQKITELKELLDVPAAAGDIVARDLCKDLSLLEESIKKTEFLVEQLQSAIKKEQE